MIDTLSQLFIAQLRDLYHAEKQQLQTLPRLHEVATKDGLRAHLDRYLDQTRDQVVRLERVFGLVNEEPQERKCRAMQGLIAETEDTLRDCVSPDVRDAAIVASMQRIQHYQIAGYGTVRTYARMIGEEEASKLLQTTLDEEGEADRTLTELAERDVNSQALAG